MTQIKDMRFNTVQELQQAVTNYNDVLMGKLLLTIEGKTESRTVAGIKNFFTFGKHKKNIQIANVAGQIEQMLNAHKDLIENYKTRTHKRELGSSIQQLAATLKAKRHDKGQNAIADRIKQVSADIFNAVGTQQKAEQDSLKFKIQSSERKRDRLQEQKETVVNTISYTTAQLRGVNTKLEALQKEEIEQKAQQKKLEPKKVANPTGKRHVETVFRRDTEKRLEVSKEVKELAAQIAGLSKDKAQLEKTLEDNKKKLQVLNTDIIELNNQISLYEFDLGPSFK